MGNDRGLLSIGEVATATGLRTSALRYYEESGLIRPAARMAGRRHYDPSVLGQLALIAACQEVGFRLTEIAEWLGEQRGARDQWQELAERKLAELDAHIERAKATRHLLQETLACGCEDPSTCELVVTAAQRGMLSAGREPARP